MAELKVSLRDVIIRPARASDYDSIMEMSGDIFKGRDIIPEMYHEYLLDPNRIMYVAELQGKVVCYVGGRVMDAGETYEGEGIRTHERFRGNGTYLHSTVRFVMLRREIPQRWPRLKRIRFVSLQVNTVRSKPHLMRIIPYSVRIIRELIYKKPRLEVLELLSKLPDLEQTGLNQLTRAKEQELRQLFLDRTSQDNLLPNGVLVRDNHSFTVSPEYVSNIPSILSDRMHAMFSTKTGSHLSSLSFGTPIPSGINRSNLRYGIDFYGSADVELIKCHIIKHFLEIPVCLGYANKCNTVSCSIFIPSHVYNEINCDVIISFVTSQLNFGVNEETGRVFEQCVGDLVQSMDVVAKSKF